MRDILYPVEEYFKVVVITKKNIQMGELEAMIPILFDSTRMYVEVYGAV